MVEMELYEVRIDDHMDGQIIILKEKDGTRILPILIGTFEAYSIRSKIYKNICPRPLTHDLFANVLSAMKIQIQRIIINKLEATVVGDQEHGTFFARLMLETEDGRVLDIDSRPSDAIALAVRTDASIYAEEDVLDRAAPF